VAALYDLGIPTPPAPVSLWRDLFVLVDKGDTKVSDYPILEKMVLEQSEEHPGGLGCLVIIPANASPPPDDVRAAIKGVLTRLAPKLRCLCWVVEGSGFRAAAVRATLTGLRMFSRPPYPTNVASSMSQALTWVMAHLAHGTGRAADVPIALDAIERARPRNANSVKPEMVALH
jgi:hypothetical protein